MEIFIDRKPKIWETKQNWNTHGKLIKSQKNSRKLQNKMKWFTERRKKIVKISKKYHKEENKGTNENLPKFKGQSTMNTESHSVYYPQMTPKIQVGKQKT